MSVLPPSGPHLQNALVNAEPTGGFMDSLSRCYFLTAPLKLFRDGNLFPLINNVILAKVQQSRKPHHISVIRTSTNECSSSHAAVASSTAKLACGVIVDMICSIASAASPGIAYR